MSDIPPMQGACLFGARLKVPGPVRPISARWRLQLRSSGAVWPLIRLCDRVASHGAGETALRADREAVEVDEWCCPLGSPFEHLDAFQRGNLAAPQAEHDAPADEGAREPLRCGRLREQVVGRDGAWMSDAANGQFIAIELLHASAVLPLVVRAPSYCSTTLSVRRVSGACGAV